jgi:hypothetical protein
MPSYIPGVAQVGCGLSVGSLLPNHISLILNGAVRMGTPQQRLFAHMSEAARAIPIELYDAQVPQLMPSHCSACTFYVRNMPLAFQKLSRPGIPYGTCVRYLFCLSSSHLAALLSKMWNNSIDSRPTSKYTHFTLLYEVLFPKQGKSKAFNHLDICNGLHNTVENRGARARTHCLIDFTVTWDISHILAHAKSC